MFLMKENLPLGLIPRYRGNRLHIFFHICGVLVEHRAAFQQLLSDKRKNAALRGSIMSDLNDEHVQLELQVLLIVPYDSGYSR
jgi:hypothetical protein